MPKTPAERLRKSREYGRRYRAANPEKERDRQRRARETESYLKSQREYRARIGPEGRRTQYWALNHGMRPENWAAMWNAQGGLCYLCQDPLDIQAAHIDHDHDCCPKDHSCSFCRRGLACPQCNQLIGMAHDDPDRLRRIAGNLEVILAVVAERMAAKPEQLTLNVEAS